MSIASLRTLTLTALATSLLAVPAFAAVPTTMNVEGVLTATGGAPAADGDYLVTFALYNVPSGGTSAWSEVGVTVSIKGGQFSYALGKSKPLSADMLAKLSNAWIGMKVGAEPELPRQPLRSVAYALRAAAAETVQCSGCVGATELAANAISADKLGFGFAGAKTKGGPATTALDLQCTGCVSVAELKIDADLDLGGNALKAKKVSAGDMTATTVTASSFIGDGSKLSGIKTAAGTCSKAGQVVKGINGDGTLLCVDAMDPAGLPPDGIDEISNGLIANQFLDETKVTTPVPIADNNPTGVSSTLDFPDIGQAQKLDVWIDISNSDLATVEVNLFDPDNAKYALYSKGGKGTSLKATYPSGVKPISGDLTTWVGKNPKGKWRLSVIDTGFKNNTNDGQINAWGVKIQTLSNKKIQVAGRMIVKGEADLEMGAKLGNNTTKCTAAIAGTIRFTGKLFEGCDGANWISFTEVGTTQMSALKDCKAILVANPTAQDGLYWIDPNEGSTADAFQVMCNMSRAGGGWVMGVKHWYGSGANGKTGAVGSVSDAMKLKGSPYKLSDANIKLIIGAKNNFDVMFDQAGYNSSYSNGNFEYMVIENYTAAWTWAGNVAASSTTTKMTSYRASDHGVAWQGNFTCGNVGKWGINCLNVSSGPNPGGGSGCKINMGKQTSGGWHHLYMADTNSDTYMYLCNGAQHSSGHNMNHRYWFRGR